MQFILAPPAGSNQNRRQPDEMVDSGYIIKVDEQRELILCYRLGQITLSEFVWAKTNYIR